METILDLLPKRTASGPVVTAGTLVFTTEVGTTTK